MRQSSLSLLLVLGLVIPSLQAEEAPIEPSAERQVELEHRLSENQQQREATRENLDAATSAAGQAQLLRLRQENQRLRLQLEHEQAQTQVQPPLLNDQQQWFAVGGGVGVLGFLLGVLTTRGRRRRQWLN
ncbi:hypothetical protein [Stutzerimonas stutzeri]|uniref:hypothetical protein n=1 Tax=Stutzerimonas stutzeri TaxID=316 RepID=UPI000382BBC4|nr:hypothetical protein [Stutzerimonas stutzeri]